MAYKYSFGRLELSAGDSGALFTLVHKETSIQVGGPVFEVDGLVRGEWTFSEWKGERALPRGGREITARYIASGDPPLELTVILRGYPDSPVLRMCYRLSALQSARLTKRAGTDNLRYFTIGAVDPAAMLTEIQLSHFDPVCHTYRPGIETYAPEELHEDMPLVGPIVLLHTGAATLLAAYEHGADAPLAFFEFHTEKQSQGRYLTLYARNGHYYHGQHLAPEQPWKSVWLEVGLAPLPLREFMPLYRRFLLEEMSESTESRRPYIYYNTWNFQERNHLFRKRPYLESMNQERILAEIEVAHRIGVEVFVIDTGWYEKTGDWNVSLARFPNGLRDVRERLERYGMRLGLWFNPAAAAESSAVYRAHPEYEVSWNGQSPAHIPIWETEPSATMCMVSGYAEEYLQAMVRLYHELGVTYYKWDALGQFGCNSPLHDHGGEENPPEERAACFAFEMGRRLTYIAEEAGRRCPGIIVDLDMTECGRIMGLGFLSAGKFFLMNNGPYMCDTEPPEILGFDPWYNLYFHPGAARSRVCRRGVEYDPIIPSVLYLTHFLPDAPSLSQLNSLASLVLGGNGIWGDLLALSEEDIRFWAENLDDYRRVREAVTRAYPRRRGRIGDSPEIHEKIEPATASGLIAFFTFIPAQVVYVTQPLDLARLAAVKGADAWEALPDGRLKIFVNLSARNDARVVFILGRED